MPQTSPNNLLTVRQLAVGYETKFPILADVSLELGVGNTYALLGGNGSGKTTLFRTLAGILPKLNGSIQKRKGANFSYVPQAKKMRLDFPLHVQDVLLMERNGFPWKRKSFTNSEISMLEKTGVWEYRMARLSDCSGGQLQRVLILRAIFAKSDLVFLDEPMDALDHKSRDIFQKILFEEGKQKGISLFLITHSLEADWSFGFDQIFELDEGKLYKITEGERPPLCHHHD